MPKKLSGSLKPTAKSEKSIYNKIHIIRNQKVILDYDLAEFYGYTTKAFNQQVARNMEKFEGEDFMFQLTYEEFLRSQNVTSNNGRGGHRYHPYAFTEQGIYMLMTILRGDLATKQSRTLIRLFKAMKNYIIENQELLDYKSNLELALKITDNAADIIKIKTELTRLNTEIAGINHKLEDTVGKSDLSPIMLNFNKAAAQREYILLDGQLAKASEIYIDFYSQANHSIHIIDDYINIKTLRHLQRVKHNVRITVFTDNIGNYLHQTDYNDFRKEFPNIKISFIRTAGCTHDRFIILDQGTNDEVVYHCGSSAKDAGLRLTVISKIEDESVHETMQKVISRLSANSRLILK